MEQNNKEIVDYIEIDSSHHSQSSTNSKKSNYCSICLETEEINTRYIEFPCQHVFHVYCFETYIEYNIHHNPNKVHIKCPICRKTFSSKTLKNIFSISHENRDKNITVLIPNDDDTITNTSQIRECTRADVCVILFLILGITLYLLALDNII